MTATQPITDQPSTSKAKELSTIDWKKNSIVVLKLICGAILTYMTMMLPEFQKLDFGAFSPVVMVLYTTFIDLGHRWLRNNPPVIDTSLNP